MSVFHRNVLSVERVLYPRWKKTGLGRLGSSSRIGSCRYPFSSLPNADVSLESHLFFPAFPWTVKGKKTKQIIAPGGPVRSYFARRPPTERDKVKYLSWNSSRNALSRIFSATPPQEGGGGRKALGRTVEKVGPRDPIRPRRPDPPTFPFYRRESRGWQSWEIPLITEFIYLYTSPSRALAPPNSRDEGAKDGFFFFFFRLAWQLEISDPASRHGGGNNDSNVIDSFRVLVEFLVVARVYHGANEL